MITRARGGDRHAFAALMHAHSSPVTASLRRFGLTPAEAEEVTQEVFLRAWRGLPGFAERARFSTWLYRIAFNESQRTLHHRPPDGDRRDGEGGPPRDGVHRRAPNLTARAVEPESRALDHEFAIVLHRALAELSPTCRAAVVLRDVEGLSTHEAARVAGVREAAFKSRLHRGRAQLRSLLAPYLGRDEG